MEQPFLDGGNSHPHAWMMPNRKGFPAWMHRTFHTDTYEDESHKSMFLPHQRLVRDFMHFESPYRGILLFHGLGVGKTCASIAAAEAFLAHGRKVIVMLPASLATNYRQEIMKCATFANPSLSVWNLVQVTADATLRVVTTRAQAKKQAQETRWIPGTPDVAATYGNVIRKNVAWNKLTTAEKEAAQSTLEELATKSFTFVNYNGLTLKAYRDLTQGDGTTFFKDALIVMDEAHNFISRVANGGKVARKMYEDMMMTPSARLVLLTGTPVINHPFELCLLLNLVRGMMRIVINTRSSKKSSSASKDADFTEDAMRTVIGDSLASYVDHLSVSSDTTKIYFTLCPEGFQLDKDKRMTRKDWDMTSDKLERAIHHKLAEHYGLDKDFKHEVAWALPTSKDEFIKMYMDVTDPEMPKVKNMDMFMRRIMGLVSYVRTTGEENFPRVTARHVEPIPMSDFQFRIYNKVRGTERTLEKKQKQKNRMSKGADGLFGAQGTVYRAFSRMACNFVFPDDIQRKYPMDLKKEMQRVLLKELDSTEDEREADKEATAAEQRTTETDKKLAKQYEANLKAVMKSLKERAADLLSPPSLNDVYSPKIARVLEHVQTSPGKTLIYSQFRSVEGLGVLQLTLEQAGYVRLELTKKNGSWAIVNAASVLDPKYHGKRYIVFDGDREKTKVLLQIFNGDFQGLPKELWNRLLEFANKKNPTNLRGELLSVLMITQSGAEGISLKNVRRVLILEPFWNMVRMDQVIGRAVRNNSHVELPQEERAVDVYIYTTVFTQTQLEKDFTLRNLDEGLTSDAHIMRIAQNKDEIIQTFLNHMKMAALDCRNHASKNMILRQGIRCYAYPVPVQPAEESFLPDMTRDVFHKSRMVRTRRVQGKVVLLKNKKFVVVEEYPGKLFNYDAYKNAGILEEADHL